MKSNWIHCRAFGFSEQTHHFLKSGSLCHPGLRGSWLCLVPITCLPGWVGLVLWLCWGSAGRVCLAFCGWSDFPRSPVYVWFPNKAAPHFLPLIKKLASPFHSITSPYPPVLLLSHASPTPNQDKSFNGADFDFCCPLFM